MQVTYNYAGPSHTSHDEDNSKVSFSPDLLRDPAFFVGAISNHVHFREAISTLHHVVVSDLRFKPKDRTEYFAWLETQKEQMLVEAAAEGKVAAEKLEQVRNELKDLNSQSNKILGPYYKAQKKYFDWIYKTNYDAWIVLDPVIAIHPDEISFECFSTDESTYGRLSCDLEMFDEINEFQNGVTNIDYSWQLYNAFQQIRSYRRTELRVEPGGFSASTENASEIFEQKIDLPDSWMRGFLQVSTAMSLPLQRLTLHPMDVHNICFHLRRQKEKHSPRSLRFQLKPEAPPKLIFEPWNTSLDCPRAVFHGSEEIEIRLWGRRRLLILERLIPLAKSFDFYLLGSGLPTFIVADLGPMKFTLGLSGWTANDWSRAGQFDLLAPRNPTSTQTVEQVFNALQSRWLADIPELAADTQLERTEVASAMTLLAQHGRAMFDLDKNIWRFRELSRDPLPFNKLRFQSEEESKANDLVNNNLVEINHRQDRQIEGIVTENGRGHPVTIQLDEDERLVNATCSCSFYRQNKLRRGPCCHILALRRFASQGSTHNKIVKGPWG